MQESSVHSIQPLNPQAARLLSDRDTDDDCMTKKTILFDLDGTLVDNFEAIHQSYQFTQEQLDLPPATYEKVRQTVGGSVPVTMRRLLGDAFTEAAIPLFVEHFREHFHVGLRLLPGARELLEALRDSGKYQLAVFTNKNHEISQKVCQHLGISSFFRAIEGAERPEGFRKPNRDFSEHILKKMDANPASTWMIGDSPFDAQAAQAVNLAGVYLVATGSHTVSELQVETDADGIYETMNDLAARVFSLEI